MIKSDLLTDITTIKHGFFTRENGFSTGVYQSLNMGRGSNDDPENVEKNYDYVASTLKIDSLLTVKQIHSNKVIIADKVWTPDQRPEGDAIVTKLQNVGLGILTADCGPMLLVDTENHVIGAAHLGRKGIFTGLLENTVQSMEELGANRNYIHAVLGPTISKDNYQVGSEVYDSLMEYLPEYEYHIHDTEIVGKYQLDMIGLLDDLCDEADINFQALNLCTYADEKRFYSYRRSCHKNEEDYGRLISVIALR